MEGASASHVGGSILVVDDDWQMREVLQQVLEAEGFRVETAADGREALERATRARPSLLVLDMGLPIVDGYGVAEGLRRAYDDPPPIVVITADGRAAEKAQRVQAVAYLSKPFDLDRLCETVERSVERG